MRKRLYMLLGLLFVSGCQSLLLDSAEPNIIDSTGIKALVEKHDFPLSIGKMAFYRGSLYVSSNIGLFVVHDSKVQKLYRWTNEDPVVDEIWTDTPNGSLWVQPYTRSFKTLGPKGWISVRLPPEPSGLTRGDVLVGFRVTPSSREPWVVFAGRAYRWSWTSSSWDVESANNSRVAARARVGDEMVSIVRDPSTDEHSVVITPGPVRLRLPEGFEFESAVATNDAMYVLSVAGQIVRIRLRAAALVPSPGACEAIALQSDGALVASFVKSGVYELAGEQWHLRLKDPHSAEERGYRAYLAAAEGQIAYANMTDNNHRPSDETTALWVSRDGRLKRVALVP